MSQTAVNKQLKKHARTAHEMCDEVPLDIHVHQLRHEQLQTTMVYIDITIEQELKALATLEDENDKKVSKKWKNGKGGLAEFCGVKSMKK